MRDIAFVIDSTGSMAARWPGVIQLLRSLPLELDDRLLIVQYWDHKENGHHAYNSLLVHTPASIIEMMPPFDGGDGPEAVFDGLAAAGNLPWRTEAQHLAVLIGDVGPHWYYPSLLEPGVTQDNSGPHCNRCGITLGGIAELYTYHQIQLTTHCLAMPWTGTADNPTITSFHDIAEACRGKCVDRLDEIPLLADLNAHKLLEPVEWLRRPPT